MLDRLGRRLAEAIANSCNIGTVHLSDAARPLWKRLYLEMAADEPGGLLGDVTARPEPQTLRLALIYALLDESAQICPSHISAAWALWRYSRASAAYIFGDALGDDVADRLLAAIRRAGPQGLDGTAQSAALGRHVPAARLDQARRLLEKRGLIDTTTEPTGGRPRVLSRDVRYVAKEAKEAREGHG